MSPTRNETRPTCNESACLLCGISHKLTPQRLSRKALVYLRLSSPRQVQQSKESQRLQYALADRAREMGFEQVEIVDADLGASASMGAAPRKGFERVISSVALGEVGIILSREVARLSRTDKDWCHLQEVCQLFDTLIGDDKKLYDLNSFDDRLVLGIKATMSAAELGVLQMRMAEGREEKARWGELAWLLPPGYVRDASDQVVKDPDRRVQQAIGLVFSKFGETWSIRQTFLWFQHEGVELPVNKSMGGQMTQVWQLPSHSFVRSVLHNPFYAGAYVYGQRPTETRFESGRLVKRQEGHARRPQDCRVFLRDHHQGYIGWATYEENIRLMARSGQWDSKDETVTAIRAGKGLLAGLLRCGRCGRRLHVRYWGQRGTNARYLCKGDFDAGGSYCRGFGGAMVDRRFGQEVLAVLSPLGVRASLQALERLEAGDDDRCVALENQLEQVEYAAQKAFEQYDEVDPRNRLVAQELERRWNVKLEEVERLRAALAELDREPRALDEEDRATILALGERFADVWSSDRCPVTLKKQIVRTVVEDVVVDHDEASNMLRFVVHWKGGSHTQFEMERPGRNPQRTGEEDLEIIRGLGVRYGDGVIAGVLNQLGRRTGKGLRWNQERVHTARRNHSIPGHKETVPDPNVLSLGEAARHAGVSQTTIKRLVASGLLVKEQVVPWAPWEIRRADMDSEPVAGILRRLRETGKLVIEGGDSATQEELFS